MAGLVLFSSCSEKDNKDDNTTTASQKLEKMTVVKTGSSKEKSSWTIEFQWNGDLLQSVVQTETRSSGTDVLNWVLNYNGDKLSTILFYEKGSLDATYNCFYTGDLLTEVRKVHGDSEQRFTIGYNGNGEMTSVVREGGWVCNLTWQNGNVMQLQRTESDGNGTKIWKYTFDDKPSSFTGFGLGVICQIDEIYDGGVPYMCKNNVLTEQTIYSDGSTGHSYDYTYTYDDDGYPKICTRSSNVFYFKYIGKSDPAPAY